MGDDLCPLASLLRSMPAAPDHAFSHEFQVPGSAIDALGHANNVEYVRWVQDVAGAHWLRICPAEFRDQIVWVVREHRIRYLQSTFVGETLRGQHLGGRNERGHLATLHPPRAGRRWRAAVRGGNYLGTARPQERPAGAGDSGDGELAAGGQLISSISAIAILRAADRPYYGISLRNHWRWPPLI